MNQLIVVNDGKNAKETFDKILAKRNLADTTRYRYGREIELATDAKINLLDASAVSEYAATLPSSRKMFLRAAVGLLADEMIGRAKQNATPDNVAEMQATMWRAEALKDSIYIKVKKGTKAHTWLSREEVKILIRFPDTDEPMGLRDRMVLSSLLGAGLRRDELVKLQWSDFVQQGNRLTLNIIGKGNKQRMIPISDSLASLLGQWADSIGRSGFVVRSFFKGNKVRKKISGQGVMDIVQYYGVLLGKPELRPHDLRRTYARIGYDSGIDIGQISKLLGHASIGTTQRYLGLEIDTTSTISDFMPV